SPDSRRLLSASAGETKLWDPTSGCEVLSFENDTVPGMPVALFWHPDGRRLGVTHGRSAQFWDAGPGYEHAGPLPGLLAGDYRTDFPRPGSTPGAGLWDGPSWPDADRGFVRSWRYRARMD